MSAEHTDQTAPRLAQARNATAVCGTFGMKAHDAIARRDAEPGEFGGERADLAAQLGPARLLERFAALLQRLVAKDDRRMAGGMRRGRRGAKDAARS